MHRSLELFKCHICSYNVRHRSSLKAHLRRHEQGSCSGKVNNYSEADKIFNCVDCGEIFPSVWDSRRHRIGIHGRSHETILVCHIYHYSTNRLASFKDHVLCHIGNEEHKCSKCENSFNIFKRLQIHMKVAHRIMLLRNHNTPLDPSCEKILLRCRKCEAEFECEKDLFEHWTKEHGGGRFRCDIGKSAFFNKNTLLKHMQPHEKARKLKCRFCDKWYSRQDSRKFHEDNAHRS